MLEDEIIIDLNELSNSPKINNSDIILSILEICTFNKRYNYECSNNTKSFWDRVVKEEVLKKIFKNFKPETLRKYWKIIREAGDNNKYIETTRNYSKVINNPKYKLLQVINCISSYIKSGEEDFKKFFRVFDPKQKFNNDISSTNTNTNTNLNDHEQNDRNDELFNKIQDENDLQDININNENTIENNNNTEKNSENDNDKNVEIENINSENVNSDSKNGNINNSIENDNKSNNNDEIKKDEIEPKIKLLDNIIDELMKITKFSREEVFNALYATSNNIENAYLYLMQNEQKKNEIIFFRPEDDAIIKTCKNIEDEEMKKLIEKKGEKSINERKKFLNIE